MNRNLAVRAVVNALIVVLAYSPVLGSVSGTLAAAQTVQNTTYRYQYDAVGNLIEVADSLGGVRTQSYDALSRLKQQVLPPASSGATRAAINYDYDGLDQISAVRDPRNLLTSYTNDGLGNQLGVLSPDAGGSAKTYDAAGNLQTSTDARGKVTNYSYDALNRVISVRFSSGLASNFEYDGGAAGAANAIGHLTKMSDESGQTSYAYNQQGRLLSKVQSSKSAGTVLVRTLNYAYGSDGKLSSLTYPSCQDPLGYRPVLQIIQAFPLAIF